MITLLIEKQVNIRTYGTIKKAGELRIHLARGNMRNNQPCRLAARGK